MPVFKQTISAMANKEISENGFWILALEISFVLHVECDCCFQMKFIVALSLLSFLQLMSAVVRRSRIHFYQCSVHCSQSAQCRSSERSSLTFFSTNHKAHFPLKFAFEADKSMLWNRRLKLFQLPQYLVGISDSAYTELVRSLVEEAMGFYQLNSCLTFHQVSASSSVYTIRLPPSSAKG